MKTLPDHRAAGRCGQFSDPGLFNLPRAVGRTLMSMAAPGAQDTSFELICDLIR